ncbi:N-acetyl-D-Glu racemase DgcA [Aureimonas sp. AU4]|uniref:N-acetyl-D-Glu racemase DgcA n=1 Tax=Aureimonas sp. AU4 TaxID=1638163 RepID=UPI00078075B1|nr:N-acetyl-D-Glu racemase DgcA [Aureimonas sp. AU4]
MRRRLLVTVERWPLAAAFTISRGSKTEAVVVRCRIEEDGAAGQGECVPYPRYNETPDGVASLIETMRDAVESGLNRDELQSRLPAGAARNALDCALWDLEAKQTGTPVWKLAGLPQPAAVETAFTISLATPDAMAEATRAAASRPVLKIKLGGGDGLDGERLEAVRQAAPEARLLIDANEGWRGDVLAQHMRQAAAIGASVVEQPLPASDDIMLANLSRPLPVCADESVHGADSIAALAGRYDFLNLKLDKTGGLTEGLRFLREARAHGFGVMVGCMVGTSLSMAPALLLAQEAEFVDLDGPLLLSRDREPGLRYEGSRVFPATPALWG